MQQKHLLKNGILRQFDKTEEIISAYLNESSMFSYKEYFNLNTAPGDSLVKLLRSEVIDDASNNKSNFLINEKIGVRITYQVLEDTDDLVMGFNLYNQMDVHVLSSHQNIEEKVKNYKPGKYEVVVWLPENFMAEGIHYCGVAAMSYRPFTVHFHDLKTFSFNVVDIQNGETVRGNYTGEFPGVIRPKLNWTNIN